MDTVSRGRVLVKAVGKCAYCGKRLEGTDWHIDHVIPKAHGGSDSIDNLLPACRRCNTLKKDRTPEEFVQFIRDSCWVQLYDYKERMEKYLAAVAFKDEDLSEGKYYKLLQALDDALDALDTMQLQFWIECVRDAHLAPEP